MAKNFLQRWHEANGGNYISIHELIQKYHIDIGQIAELIVKNGLPIAAITTKNKSGMGKKSERYACYLGRCGLTTPITYGEFLKSY